MAVTQNTYTGNGSTVLYNFTFPYLQETDVQVKLDGATQATSTYTFANATTIQFNSAPGNGVRIIIFRNTDNDNKKATFYPGSAIKAEDLNDNIDQILYVAQEVDNNAMSSLGDTQMQGDLEFGQGMGLVFEGATTDANETRLGVIDPTADRVINLPNVSGTVVTTGDTGSVTSTMILDGTIVSGDIADGTIVNADINASAAIAGTKIDPSFGTQNLSLTGNISVSGTVDGRDVSTDGSKLDGIESGATADQTAAEIRTLVESATDSNVFTDADHTKLNNIETAATADQTASEIKSLYESNGDTNPLTDAEKTFLSDVTATATEINYTTNVTSDIQSQIDGKQPLDSELTTLAGMQTQTASQLASSTALSATTTNLNITQGMTKATSLTTDSDTEFPTSKAVNDRILTVTNALGGFVAIADKDNFPTSHPDPSGNAGTVVSISNASGISVNSSGVGTLATRAGGSDAVIINGFPSALRGGATVDGQPNANPFVLPANVGLQVQTTGTAHTYDYHKYFINEEEANKLSGSIQSFQERYRVAASAPTSNNDDGDLYFDTTANKMKVYNASSSSWDDVATPGNFLLNTISSSSGSGGGSATFNGTATRFTLSNPPDQYAQQLLVSINGVIQKPNSGTSPSEGFAIDGNDIIFASAPASGSDYFIVTQGSSVNIGTPSNNTVSTATIQSGAITNDKVNASAAIAGTKISPNFGSQNIVTTGNVGIGTTSPSTTLHIADGTAPGIRIQDTDNVNSDFKIYSPDGDNALRIYHQNTSSDLFHISSTGNVGITTNSPSVKFDVARLGSAWSGQTPIAGTVAHLHNGNNAAGSSAYIALGAGNASYSGVNFGDSDDADVGRLLYSHIDNSLRIFIDASERARITSAGLLGIGTTSPSGTIHANAADGVDGPIFDSGGTANNSHALLVRDSGNNQLLRVNNNGLVGIGTNSPRSILDLGTGSGDGTLSSTLSQYQIMLEAPQGSGDYGRNIGWAVGTNGLTAAINAVDVGAGDATGLTFITGTNSAVAERLRIDQNGRIGIGETDPDALMHLKDSSPRIILEDTGTGAEFRINADSSVGNASFDVDFNSATTSPSLYFMIKGGEKMRIKSDGNIAIGGSSSSTRLYVKSGNNNNGSNCAEFLNSDDDQLLRIRNDGLIQVSGDSGSPYTLTTSSAANAFWNSNRVLMRSTSSIRYKKDIKDATWGLAEVLKLKPVTFKSNVTGEFADDQTYAGFTAEDIHDLGLTEFVQYNEKNEPESLNYGHMVSLMAKAIQELSAKVTALEAA